MVSGAIAVISYVKCRVAPRSRDDSNKEVFLAGGGLSWVFVAGSITLTNLGTDQLVGMNGNQMLLMAWWEIAAVIGLIVLAKVFLPQYYKYQCTTTELLGKRYNNKNIRVMIGTMFFIGITLIWMPAAIYSGSLLFAGVDARAGMLAVLFGVALYTMFTFAWTLCAIFI